jgi:hypothetical protein
MLLTGVATAGGSSLTGTWHQRDLGTSNIFYFIDAPVDGVYPVVFYDDWTGVCPDNGPMMWTGFGSVDPSDPDTLNGTFGEIWCTDIGDGVNQHPNQGINQTQPFELSYDPATDTIEGGVGATTGQCLGTRQPHIVTPAKAIHELGKDKFPPSHHTLDIGCYPDGWGS